VAGIRFIGGGAIMRTSEGFVAGLTVVTTIWAVVAIELEVAYD